MLEDNLLRQVFAASDQTAKKTGRFGVQFLAQDGWLDSDFIQDQNVRPL